MGSNQKIEDYMKAVFLLRQNGAVRGAYIARELGVTKPTVSVSLKEMENAGYLRILPDRTVALTAQGEALARRVMERNELIYRLLRDLGVSRETAQEDACRMEHDISDETLQALEKLRGYLALVRDMPWRNQNEEKL